MRGQCRGFGFHRTQEIQEAVGEGHRPCERVPRFREGIVGTVELVLSVL